jgi:hypothetical protein
MFFACAFFQEGVELEICPRRGQCAAGYMLDLWSRRRRSIGGFSALHWDMDSLGIQKAMRRRELSRSPHCRCSARIMP